MFPNRKISRALLFTCAIAVISTTASADELNFSVIYEVSGQDAALEKFKYNYDQRKTKFGILAKYCTDPIRDSSGKSLIFVCKPPPEVFFETGIVFLETTKPKSPMTDLTMSATAAISCGGLKCVIEQGGGTPCWSRDCSGGAKCFHYPYGCTSTHICKPFPL